MDRALVVTVRFQEGRYHGTGDWPPAPARLFQALVAGAARGSRLPDAEREALDWLERLDPPRIAAPVATRARHPRLYVPNNDLDAQGGDPAKVGAIRAEKRTELRLFDRDVPCVYVWRAQAPMPPALPGLVDRLYRLGRGTDPAYALAEWLAPEEAEARLRAHPGLVHEPGGGGAVPCPAPGSLASLERRHAALLGRLRRAREGKAAVQVFAQPPRARFAPTGYETPPRRVCFDLRRPEDGAFAAIALDRAGPLVDGLRRQAAARLAGHGVPEAGRVIVGLGAGPRDMDRRVRVIAIPSIGHAEADPSIRRILVEVPQTCPVPPDDVFWSFAGLAPVDPATGEIWGEGLLARSDDATMAGLFVGPARRWRSLTPLALGGAERRRIQPGDGPPKDGAERAAEEAAAARAVGAALRHAGLRATASRIQVQREPHGRREAPAERFAAGTRFGKHALWHLDLTLDRAVPGPMLLGDGRFTGLGLMRPVLDIPGTWQLRPDTRLADAAEVLSRALRRAVMAAAQAEQPNRELPEFFHGHQPDGAPLRDGGRHHLAFVADIAGNRLLVIAPHLADRRAPTATETRHLRRLEAPLARLHRLVAGPAGAYDLVAEPVADDDPLFDAAHRWVSLTDYLPTRHPRRQGFTEALGADLAEECRRRRLPVPEIDVLRRGDGLACRLRLSFARAVAGPVLLGRTAMRGGGLFGPLP